MFISKIESKISATHKIYHGVLVSEVIYAYEQFCKRYLDFSTRTSNLRVNHSLTMVTFSYGLGNFLLAISSDLRKKNKVFGNICLSGKVEMIDFNPIPFIVLSSQQGCVN